MEFIGFLLVGLIAGWLAGVITKTNRNIIGDLILGVLGAIVGGFVTQGFGSESFILELIVATVFAVILVYLKNMVMNRSSSD